MKQRDMQLKESNRLGLKNAKIELKLKLNQQLLIVNYKDSIKILIVINQDLKIIIISFHSPNFKQTGRSKVKK